MLKLKTLHHLVREHVTPSLRIEHRLVPSHIAQFKKRAGLTPTNGLNPLEVQDEKIGQKPQALNDIVKNHNSICLFSSVHYLSYRRIV
jgi:pSer/pThr/pTyr-binding forkhead associated (FHA) protein